MLYRMSPKEDMSLCNWYEEPESGNPTRKQRIQYSIYGGMSEDLLDEFGVDVLEMKTGIRKLLKVIGKLSKYTHVNEDTFDLPDKEVGELSEDVLNTFKEYIDQIEDLKGTVIQRIEDVLIKNVTDKAIFQNYENVGSLAPHFSMNGAEVTGCRVLDIKSDKLILSVDGSIDVTLEYGSRQQRKENDGLDLEQHFDFETTANLTLDDDISNLIESVEVAPFGVNTDEWYE